MSSSPIDFKKLAPADRKHVQRELCWTRGEDGSVIYLSCIHDYRPCEAGGEPGFFIKRHSGRRPRRYRGRNVLPSPLYAQLPMDVWCEMTFTYAGGAS